MNIKELITLLSRQPGDQQIMVQEMDIDDDVDVIEITLQWNYKIDKILPGDPGYMDDTITDRFE